MALSVTEKEEIKKIIEADIDAKVKRIWGENAGEREILVKKSIDLAIKKLGLTSLMSRYKKIEDKEKELDEQKKNLRDEMIAKIEDKTVEQVRKDRGYRCGRDEVDTAINEMQQVVFEDLVAKHPVLGEITRLETEKTHLLKNVWTATGTAAVKQLFAAVNTLLGLAPTELTKEAYAIDPSED